MKTLAPAHYTVPPHLHDLAAAAHRRSPAWVVRVPPMAGCLFGGFMTVALLVAIQAAGASLWVVNASVMAPALVTFALVRGSVRRLYRWFTILTLAQVIHPAATAPFLLAAVTWALYRSWVLERAPRTDAHRRAPAAHTPVVTREKKTAHPAKAGALS